MKENVMGTVPEVYELLFMAFSFFFHSFRFIFGPVSFFSKLSFKTMSKWNLIFLFFGWHLNKLFIINNFGYLIAIECH